MKGITEYERLISIRIMQEDAENIYSLLKTEQDSVFGMEIIPYYALFVQSCQEYIGENLLTESIVKDLKDIRNHIKIYANSFGKSQKRVATVDDMQDRDFKEQLKFEFLKNTDIHLNLGMYWTEERIIIGNTQQIADFLSVESMFDPKLKEKNYQMGYHIGSFVASIREGLADSLHPPMIERNYKSIAINYYCDVNTNKILKRNKIFLKDQTKEVNLFYLHLLCNMNFVKYILRPLFQDGNIWIFRIEYIVSYYTLRAFERLKNYCENNKDITVENEKIYDILKRGELLFTTKLRNCMMHYNLENAGVISIENIDKPFYGIIENCFNGKSYKEYLIELDGLSDMIINFLNSQFDFSDVKIRKL